MLIYTSLFVKCDDRQYLLGNLGLFIIVIVVYDDVVCLMTHPCHFAELTGTVTMCCSGFVADRHSLPVGGLIVHLISDEQQLLHFIQ